MASVARMLLDFVRCSKWNIFVLRQPSRDNPFFPMGAAAVRKRGAEVLLGLDGLCARPGSSPHALSKMTRDSSLASQAQCEMTMDK